MVKITVDSYKELEAIYRPVSLLSMNKVLESFDVHTTGFLEAARFIAANVRDAAGASVPVFCGGPSGFARVVNSVTAEIDLASEDWPQERLPLGPDAEYETGLLLVIPGVPETMRLRGRLTLKQTDEPSRLKATLRLHSTFFHCGKAFLRGQVWPDPSERGKWKGLRTFRCVAKVMESENITSFHLRPVDNRPLPVFIPGQHVAVEIAVGEDEPLRRVYSLSDRPGKDTWRITVKREQGPNRASAYLHDRVGVGDILRLRPPSGNFKLDLQADRPLVLLSVGVGLTPMMSMLEHLVEGGSGRKIWFFHGAASSRQHAMRARLAELKLRSDRLGTFIAYSRPLGSDAEQNPFDHPGRLTVDVVASVLPWDDYDFYICGSTDFVESMATDLLKKGARSDRLHWESFSEGGYHGPPGQDQAKTAASVEDATVVFKRSGKSFAWTGEFNSILELAELNGIASRSSCRNGICYSCATRVLAGEVNYPTPLEDSPDEGTALICCAVPAGKVVLDC